jgi:hypothetical protein
VSWFNKLPGFRRSPAGLEWKLLRRLPLIAVVGTALPILFAVAAGLLLGGAEASSTDAKLATTLQFVLMGVLVLHWTAVLTIALLCVIVWIMKGPAYVADGYALPDADRPGRPWSARRPAPRT